MPSHLHPFLTPDKTYVFPLICKRKFVHRWFDIYDWLCYSSSKDGGFCLFCVLFADDLCRQKIRSQCLFTFTFKTSSDSTRRLENHFNGGPQSLHKRCFELYCAFNQNYVTKKSVPIDIQTSVLATSKISKYRGALEQIIDVVIYHGRQGIAYRGQRDKYK